MYCHRFNCRRTRENSTQNFVGKQTIYIDSVGGGGWETDPKEGRLARMNRVHVSVFAEFRRPRTRFSRVPESLTLFARRRDIISVSLSLWVSFSLSTSLYPSFRHRRRYSWCLRNATHLHPACTHTHLIKSANNNLVGISRTGYEMSLSRRSGGRCDFNYRSCQNTNDSMCRIPYNFNYNTLMDLDVKTRHYIHSYTHTRTYTHTLMHEIIIILVYRNNRQHSEICVRF